MSYRAKHSNSENKLEYVKVAQMADDTKSYDNVIDPKLFNYRSSGYKYAAKSALHAATGLAIGIVVDRLCAKLQKGLNLRPSAMILIQLTVVVIVLYIIEMYFTKQYKFAMEWQNITPGILFAGTMFAAQWNLAENIKKFSAPL